MIWKIICLIFIPVATAVPFQDATTETSYNNSNVLIYVGSIQNQRGKSSVATASLPSPSTTSEIKWTPTESLYFKSENSAGWSQGKDDCIAHLGENATLLYIETQEELKNVTQFFNTNDIGSLYWIGGRFDVNKNSFFWENNVPIGPWAPWVSGHLDFATSVTRVAMNVVEGIQFRTQTSTTSTRYICELKRRGLIEETPKPCYNDNDLAIVIDSSGSIGQANYVIALDFAAKLAVAWADHPGNRLSVIIYSDQSQSIFDFSHSLNLSLLRERIYASPYLAGGTNSHLGLNHAIDQFEKFSRSVTKNIVFLTDGQSNSQQDTSVAAGRVQKAGIRSFAVGITKSINQNELLAIAGNKPEHVFNTDGFNDLLKLLKPVSERVCG